MKKTIAALLSLVILITALAVPSAVLAADKTYVALGENLNADERAIVLELLGLTEESLAGDTTLTVSNAEEHQYLDAYLDASVIGTRALSSCKVTTREEGSGITVETHNITYCTPAMYENALATAGLKNADIVVAGPVGISGTAALVGAKKAYSAMTGAEITPELVDAATNELITTSEVAENVGDSEKVAQLIAAVKEIILSHDYETDEDIDAAIREVAAQLGLTLSDEDVAEIRELMKKIAAADVTAESLTEQAKNVYQDLKNSGFDLSQYGISAEDVNGFMAKFGQLLADIINWFKAFFN